jgi:hypothetical protein
MHRMHVVLAPDVVFGPLTKVLNQQPLGMFIKALNQHDPQHVQGVGGPAHGYKHLVDSSLDWGQVFPPLPLSVCSMHVCIHTYVMYDVYACVCMCMNIFVRACAYKAVSSRCGSPGTFRF